MQRRRAAQAVELVGARRAGECLQHLAEWRGQILGVAGGHAAGGLRDQRAVAGVGVGRCAARGGAVQRVVGGGRRAVTQQVAGRVVHNADVRDLIGSVVGCHRWRAAVELHRRAVAGQVVGVGVHAAGPLVRADQPPQAVIGVARQPLGRVDFEHVGIGARLIVAVEGDLRRAGGA